MYTHGLIAIISTKTRYGGFAKAVGMRALTTPHGLGYCKMVIVVDEDVDPFKRIDILIHDNDHFAVAESVRCCQGAHADCLGKAAVSCFR